MIRVGALDLGTSGKSSICVLSGEGHKIKMIHLEAISSISSPDLESVVARTHAAFAPNMWLMELNGPGAVFADYITRNKPHIPMSTVDTSLPLPDNYSIALWQDIEINNKIVLNIRAAMYWILRLFFRDQRILLYKSDDELFAQLSVLRWDHDPTRGDKMFMLSKRKLKFDTSELDEEPFSKSPDKADSLALATFAYCLLEQTGIEDKDGEQEEDQIIEPDTDGFFPAVGFDGEAVL